MFSSCIFCNEDLCDKYGDDYLFCNSFHCNENDLFFVVDNIPAARKKHPEIIIRQHLGSVWIEVVIKNNNAIYTLITKHYKDISSFKKKINIKKLTKQKLLDMFNNFKTFQ